MGLCESDECIDCFISLAGGSVRSSKAVQYDASNELFYVTNEIDDTEDTFTLERLKDSNIGEAMRRGAFYKY